LTDIWLGLTLALNLAPFLTSLAWTKNESS
jgi:hypothetical protein